MLSSLNIDFPDSLKSGAQPGGAFAPQKVFGAFAPRKFSKHFIAI